jgi:5'(3')-deoxyribonucleotidase
VELPPVQRGVQAGNNSRLTVGIDLDGVLGDQIAGVLPRIKSRLGIDLTYEQITEFRLRLGSSDLADEIQLAQRDEAYLRDMPPHRGAAEIVAELRRHYAVLLITARPGAARRATERWLHLHGFEFDGVVNAEESKKSVYGADVLIDDYTGNIADFVEHTTGLGLLLDRPWNRRDRDLLHPWISGGRAVIAPSLDAVPSLIAQHRGKIVHASANLAAPR